MPYNATKGTLNEVVRRILLRPYQLATRSEVASSLIPSEDGAGKLISSYSTNSIVETLQDVLPSPLSSRDSLRLYRGQDNHRQGPLDRSCAGEPINFRIEALCACGEACRPVNDGPKRDRILGTSDKAPNDLSGCLPY